MSKVLSTITEDEKLVKMVSKYPCLYDIHHPSYKIQRIKDSSWEEISQNVEKPEEECRKRWRNIKDTYHRRRKKGYGTGSSSDSKHKWVLADMLSFLDKTKYKRRGKSNIEENIIDDLIGKHEMEDSETEAEEQITDPSSRMSDSTPPLECRQSNKQRKFNEKIVQLMEDRQKERAAIFKNLSCPSEDDTDVFFKSIAMSLKKLPSHLVNEAKLKTLQLVIDLERRAAPSP